MSDTHPLWRPYSLFSDAQITAIAAGRVSPAPAVEVVAPDPRWPAQFERICLTVRRALGARVLRLEHVGSTAVPGLWAKPFIDIDLTVVDSADEAAYLPDLERIGLTLRVREPDWEQHRMLRGTDPLVNLHVFSPGAVEPRRHTAFRDWLREHPEDRDSYSAWKRELAARGFDEPLLYNNEKAALIYDIYERIFAADPEHPHTPRPR